MTEHECMSCHMTVDCRYCNKGVPWACPWINDDEIQMCDACEADFYEAYEAAYWAEEEE